MNRIPLTKLKKGLKVRIIEVTGGRQMAHRLSTLGLRPGACLTKISAFALRGPVTVKVGSTTIALGHGMAEKVMVDARQESCR
jgi:Fe2+ transport system protein FeoA